MANIQLLFSQGGSNARNLGVASVAYLAGEVEEDGDTSFVVFPCNVQVGREHACSLPDGGSVWLVPNPNYDAEGDPDTVINDVTDDVFLTKTVPGSAYNRDTNPYDTVEFAWTANNRLLGHVETDVVATDEYIRVRHVRSEFGATS